MLTRYKWWRTLRGGLWVYWRSSFIVGRYDWIRIDPRIGVSLDNPNIDRWESYE